MRTLPISKLRTCIAALAAISPYALGQAKLLHDFNGRYLQASSDPVAATATSAFLHIGSRILCAARTDEGHKAIVAIDIATGARVELPGSRCRYDGQISIAPLGTGRACYFSTAFDWLSPPLPTLMVTDGTLAGTSSLGIEEVLPWTSPVAGRFAIYPGWQPSGSINPTGTEPWITDGTVVGTFQIADLTPGTLSSQFRVLITDSKSTLVYLVAGASNLRDLYSFDVTTLQPTRIATGLDFTCTPLDRPVANLDMRRIVFASADAVSGCEPWISDGTAAGTARIADLTPGAGGSAIQSLVAVGGRAYFEAGTSRGTEVWETDGTAAGTRPIQGGATPLISDFQSPVVAGNFIFFTGSTATTGAELYVLEARARRIRLVADIEVGPAGSDPRELTECGSFISFSAWTKANGRELWTTDGTAAGTRLVRDIAIGSRSSNPRELTSVGTGVVAFSAEDSNADRELYLSAGTPSTTLRYDLWSGTINAGSDPTDLTVVNGHVLGAFSDTNDRTVIASIDPRTRTNTRLVDLGNLSRQGVTMSFANLGTSALMLLNKSTPQRTQGLYALDPKTGARLLQSGLQYARIGTIRLPGMAAFQRLDGHIGVTDGTPAGTLDLGFFQVSPNDPVAGAAPHSGSFMIQDGYYVLSYDGSQVQRLARMNGFRSYRTFEATAVLDGWIFEGADSVSDSEPWITDGTPQGTRRIADLRPGTAGSYLAGVVTLGDRAYFSCDDGTHGRELWASDGTAAGTRMIRDLVPGIGGSNPRCMTPIGTSRLYFTATEATTGEELYVYDARTDTITLVLDLRPGTASSSPANIRSLDGSALPFASDGESIYFAADDGIHGRELWAYDLRATSTPFGIRCSQTKLFADSDPVLGRRVTVRGESPLVATRVLALGLRNYASPRIGTSSCRLHIDLVQPIVVLATTLKTPWQASISIPNSPSLRDQRLTLQSIEFASATPGFVATSNGVEWVLDT